MAKPYGWILAALLSSHRWNLDNIIASAFSNNRIILRNSRINGELGIVVRRRSTPGGGRTVLPSSAMSSSSSSTSSSSSSSSSSGPTLSSSAVVRRSPRRRAVGAAPPRGEVVSSSNSSSSSSSASASSSSTDDDDGDASRTLLEGWMRHDHHDYHVNMLSPARAYEVRLALVGWYRNRRRKLPWRGDGGPYDGSTAGYGAGSSGGGGGGGGMTKRGGANNGGSGNKNKKRRGEGEGGKADAPDIRSFFASSSSSSSSGNEKTKPGGSKAPPPLPPRDGTNAKKADDDGGESDSFDAPREVTAYGVWGEFSLFSCIIWPLLWRDESSSRHWLAKHLCPHAVPIHVLLQFRRSCSSRRGWRRSYPTGSNVSSPTHTSRVTSIEMAGIESNIILGSNRFFFHENF